MRVLATRPLRLVLARHGEKSYAPLPESALPLSAAAEKSAAALARKLSDEDLNPDLILSSRWRHAMQTAEIVAGCCGAPVAPVTGLTPFTDEKHFNPHAIYCEVRGSGIPLGAVRTVVLIGHHDRVSKLAGQLCRVPPLRELDRLEGAVLSAPSLRKLLACRATFVKFVRA